MISLVYVSAARTLFGPQQLSDLLAQSRRDNKARDVSGMLLHADGNFMQALEGDEETVDALYAKIARDPRHGHVKTLIREPLTKRVFADWSMALRHLSDLPPEDRDSCTSFLTSVASDASSPSLARKLLESFRTSMS